MRSHAGDPGQTFNTTVTLTHVMRGWGLGSSPRRPWNRGGVHLLLLLGDLRCFGFFRPGPLELSSVLLFTPAQLIAFCIVFSRTQNVYTTQVHLMCFMNFSFWIWHDDYPAPPHETPDSTKSLLACSDVMADHARSYASESIRVSPATCNITPSEGFAGSYPPRWDSWKNLLQPLLSAIPSMSVPGNHELEFLPGGATYSNWTAMQMAYNARAPQATRGPLLQPSTAPITGRESGYANSYWLNRVPGVGTFIGITNYSPNDVNVSAPNMNGFSALNEQYVWLEQQLKVGRSA
jgi:hypothetical protein